jgi:uncharacterized membrane protein YqiK
MQQASEVAFVESILFNPIFLFIVGSVLLSILIILTMKSRYMTFPPNVYVMHIRRGKIKTATYGGAFFKYPIIDEYRLLPTNIQRIEIKASEKVISKENQEIIVRGFLVWRVENAEAAFKKIAGMGSSTSTSKKQAASSLNEINSTLEQLAESVIRTTVANMTLDEILRNRGKIVDELMKEFAQVVATWGISIETVEIKDVELINQELFKHLQAAFESQKNLEAEEIKIRTRQLIEAQYISSQKEVAKAKAEADREERIIRAAQDEIAKIRELEKEKKIIEQEKLVRLAKEQQEQEVAIAAELKEQQIGVAARRREQELTEQERILEVAREEKDKAIGIARRQKELQFIDQEKVIESQRKEKAFVIMQLEQKRLIEEADYKQKEENIHAQTELIKKTKAAQAQAEAHRLNKEAEAKAHRVMIEEEAQGQAAAKKVQIEQEAEARAHAVQLAAEAEAQRIRSIADAKKLEMVNEAEGTREKLLAEAEGLAAKVEAQNKVSEAVLQQQTVAEIIKSIATVLPKIAEHMKVGEVKWINFGGVDGAGKNGSPLSIIPKNIMQLIGIMDGLGIDIPNLIAKFMPKMGNSDLLASDHPLSSKNTETGKTEDITSNEVGIALEPVQIASKKKTPPKS